MEAYEITLLSACLAIVARLQLDKNFPTATKTHARIVELPKAVFSLRCVLYQILNCSERKVSGLFFPNDSCTAPRVTREKNIRDSEPTITMLARTSTNFPNRTISSSQNLLCFCTLFNDSFLNSDSMASDDWMAVKNGLERKCKVAWELGTILGVSGWNEENHEAPHSG
jgi:hypothetical protein